MTNGEAVAIFYALNDDTYSIEEKGTAIYQVMNFETHNSFSRRTIAKAIEYILLNFLDFYNFISMPQEDARRILKEIADHTDKLDVYKQSEIFTAIEKMAMNQSYLGCTRDEMLKILRFVWSCAFEMPQ